MRSSFTGTATALVLTLMASIGTAGTALAQGMSAGPSTPIPAAPTDAFGAQVRAYILSHPEVIMEAVQILQQRQQVSQAEAAKAVVAARADEIFNDPGSPVGGNPAGDVTLVEFFDYNCHYCRGINPTLAEVRQADPGLRMVYKEFPILGPSSETAARAALAAQAQGKYAVLHEALLQAEQPLTDDRIFAIAAATGLDVARLRRDMADPRIDQAIERNRELATSLGINGTPGFVVDGQVIPGVIERAALENLIAQARGKPQAPRG